VIATTIQVDNAATATNDLVWTYSWACPQAPTGESYPCNHRECHPTAHTGPEPDSSWDEELWKQELRQAHREECREAFRAPPRRSGRGYQPKDSPVPADRSRLLGPSVRARRTM
jgi:hypothetical protein